jgi:hypothetical protein
MSQRSSRAVGGDDLRATRRVAAASSDAAADAALPDRAYGGLSTGKLNKLTLTITGLERPI